MLADTLFDTKFSRTVISRLTGRICGLGRFCSSRPRLAFTLFVTCLAMLLTLPTLAAAQEAPDTNPFRQPPAGDEVARAHLASSLVEHGLRNEDPLALITAARLYKELNGKVLEKGQTGKDGEAINVEFLLDRASEIAKDDRVKELAQAVKQEGPTKQSIYGCPFPVYEWYCPGYGLPCYYQVWCY